VNHGTQARKDIEVMRQQVAETKEMLLKTIQHQQQQITGLRNLVVSMEKENKIHRHAVERLLKESKERETKQ
jgi:hypothetical protein